MSNLRAVLGRLLTIVLVMIGPVLTGPALPAFACSRIDAPMGAWEIVSSSVRDPAVTDEGVATLSEPDGRSRLITRGASSVPRRLVAQGWVHIGDSDARGGYLIDAYQGDASARAKLFVITAPDGRQSYYRHPLDAGETYHNSFAAFTPGRRWFVSGEWGAIDRLEVFVNPTAPNSRARLRHVALASVIRLRTSVTDVQGCVFATATRLLCTSSDTSNPTTPDPLLAIKLSRPVGRATVPGAVRTLAAIPQDPTCSFPGESEGLDLHASVLTVAMNSSCRPVTIVSRFRWNDDR